MSEPDRAVIVFDGVCMLCSRSVQFVLKHDTRKHFRFATMQSTSGQALMRAHGLDPTDPASMLLFDGTRAWTDSEAVLRVAAGFGGAWRLTGAARILPGGLRDTLYRFIARRRYRWFGKRDTCMLPTVETADRFLR
ncbi:MAG: thiol-disulfide oxidoreductase DCC family protein [Usitatibacter sp.]